MHVTPKFTFFVIALFTLSTQCSEVAIRPATLDDLSALSSLDKKVMFEHFKPTIIAGYSNHSSPIAQNPELLDNFLNQYLTLRTAKFTEILQNTNTQNNGILVAPDPYNANKLRALCLFEKRGLIVYINHLIVARKVRGQGIGRALLTGAINTYDDVTTCELKALAYANEKVHNFYEKYGFASTKELVTVDPRTPDTHISYHLDIKR